MTGRLRGERGSVAVEFALAVPLAVFALVLASLAWRLTTADITLLRVGGDRTLTATAIEVIDTRRGGG